MTVEPPVLVSFPPWSPRPLTFDTCLRRTHAVLGATAGHHYAHWGILDQDKVYEPCPLTTRVLGLTGKVTRWWAWLHNGGRRIEPWTPLEKTRFEKFTIPPWRRHFPRESRDTYIRATLKMMAVYYDLMVEDLEDREDKDEHGAELFRDLAMCLRGSSRLA